MSYTTMITTAGRAALAQAHVSGVPLQFTHLALGDGSHVNLADALDRTALLHEVHRAAASRVFIDAESPTWVVIEAAIPADVGGWTVRELGLISAAGTLIAIGTFPETFKPAVSDGVSRDMVIRMIIETSDTADVSLTLDPAVATASSQTVLDAIDTHESKTDPHQQYMTKAAGAQAIELGVLQHESNPDPHPQYQTVEQVMALLRRRRAREHYFANC